MPEPERIKVEIIRVYPFSLYDLWQYEEKSGTELQAVGFYINHIDKKTGKPTVDKPDLLIEKGRIWDFMRQPALYSEDGGGFASALVLLWHCQRRLQDYNKSKEDHMTAKEVMVEVARWEHGHYLLKHALMGFKGHGAKEYNDSLAKLDPAKTGNMRIIQKAFEKSGELK